jgi:hypothetical protein
LSFRREAMNLTLFIAGHFFWDSVFHNNPHEGCHSSAKQGISLWFR